MYWDNAEKMDCGEMRMDGNDDHSIIKSLCVCVCV